MNLERRLVDLIKDHKPMTEINELCRRYVNKGIENTYPMLYPQLREIVDNYTFIECKYDSEQGTKHNYNSIVVGVGAIIGCSLGKLICNFSIIGTLIGLVVTILFLNYKRRNKLNRKTSVLKPEEQAKEIYSRVQQLEDNIDNICQVLDKTVDSNDYLDTKYRSILKLLHRIYDSAGVKDRVKNDVRELLQKFGYELVEYNYDNRYLFNSSFGKLNAPKTSVHALKNSKTDECIIKGHVILP